MTCNWRHPMGVGHPIASCTRCNYGKLHVSFAKETYKRDYILQKWPIIWRSLLNHESSCLVYLLLEICTGWRRPIGCLKLQVIFRKRASNYRALLRKMTCDDKASHGPSPPCIRHVPVSGCVCLHIRTSSTGWRGCVRCLKLHVSFRQRDTNHRALLR